MRCLGASNGCERSLITSHMVTLSEHACDSSNVENRSNCVPLTRNSAFAQCDASIKPIRLVAMSIFMFPHLSFRWSL